MVIQEQTLVGLQVSVDGGTFIKVRFERCTIVFSGILPAKLERCHFKNCTWQFAGPAQQTVAMLTSLYALDKNPVEQLFTAIRGGALLQQPMTTLLN